MKSIKVTLALSVLILALLTVLTITGAIPSEQATEWGAKSIGALIVIGIALQVVMSVLQGKAPPPSNPDQRQGPRF